MDRTTEFVEAIDKLYSRKMGAPTVLTSKEDASRWLLARDGEAVLCFTIRTKESDYECTLVSGNKTTVFCKYPERYPRAADKHILPTAKVISRIKHAVPVPVEDIWVIIEGGRVVEFIYFTDALANDCLENPTIIGVVAQNRSQPVCTTAFKSSTDLTTFWRLVSQGKLVPGRDILRKGALQFGTIPGRKVGAFIISGTLFMHPTEWERQPNITANDLLNITDVKRMVK